MKHHSGWPASALAVALLAACGGGGSDSPAPTTAAVTLSGTAAKGLMAGADVSALAVKADGTVDTTPLATTTTDASGHYTLNFTATKDQPYVIQVKAKDDGSTTHLDEVSGAAQALPAGFAMRALFVPTSTGNVSTSASVTPFSELAVAAAAKAGGGLTAANAAQAVSTVSQLLGFDPTSVTAKDAASAASANEQKLAILLTAVSKLAAGGQLGCTTGTPGEVTQCVVAKLADAASATSLKLASGATDVSAALGTAVGDVLADPTLSHNIPPSTLVSISDNLACTAPCTAAPPATASAIASATDLFDQIRSDWKSLFSRGGATSIASGAANAEAWKFRESMNAVQTPAINLVKDLGALVMGIDLYNDFKQGRTTVNTRGRGPGQFDTATPTTVANLNTVGCTLYSDVDTTIEATQPSDANFIGCRASYFTNVVGNVTTDWRHGFTITPSATEAGTFTYATRARKRTTTCPGNPCPFTSEALSNPFTGTLTTTTNSAGSITAVHATGDLAPTFADGGTTPVNDHTTWDISGTRTISGPHTELSSLTGSMAAYDNAGTLLGTLTVKDGKFSEIPVARDASFNEVKPGSPTAVALWGGAPDSVTLDLAWTTPAAEFEGVFSVGPTVWDLSGTERLPTAASISGALRNIAGGVTTEFLKGTFTATTSGFANQNSLVAASPTNFFTTSVAFVGTLTAPQRPVLKLTASASKKSYETDVAVVTLQYSALVGGTARTVIDVTASPDANGNVDFSLSEASSGLSMLWLHNATSADLKKGTEKIGTLSQADKRLTFSNGTFISLDVGL